MRLLRVVVVLALLAVAGLSAYAYFGDMAPERREMRVPVSLTGGPLPEAATTGAIEAAVAEAAAEPPAADAAEADASAPAETPAAGADVLD